MLSTPTPACFSSLCQAPRGVQRQPWSLQMHPGLGPLRSQATGIPQTFPSQPLRQAHTARTMGPGSLRSRCGHGRRSARRHLCYSVMGMLRERILEVNPVVRPASRSLCGAVRGARPAALATMPPLPVDPAPQSRTPAVHEPPWCVSFVLFVSINLLFLCPALLT